MSTTAPPAESAASEPRPAVAPDPPGRPRWLPIAVAAGILAGIVLRIVLLARDPGAFDSDEAIVGLMARHLRDDGELVSFFYGQAYGGTIEVWLTALAQGVVGSSSVFAVKFVVLALSAVAALLVWRVGRRTVGPTAAAIGAVAFWIWPANFVWLSTKARGFYWAALCLGLVALLGALRLRERIDRRDAIVLGAALGLGWWTSPQILYFAVPVTGLLVFWLRRHVVEVLLWATPAALLGAAPWIVYNLNNGWQSFDASSHVYDDGLVGNAEVFFRRGIPVAAGFHVAESWIFRGAVVVLLAVLALACARLLRGPRSIGPLVVGAITYPFVWAIFPVSGVVGEGRYVLYLAPILALLLAAAARTPRWYVALLAGCVALSANGVRVLDDHTQPFVETASMPTDLGPLIAELRLEGIDRVYADYWVAYRLAYESGEDILASPFLNSRYPPYDAAVAAAERPAFVFVAGQPTEERFRLAIKRHGERVQVSLLDEFVVYWMFEPRTLDEVVNLPARAGVGLTPACC